jgi:hypothetical protein
MTSLSDVAQFFGSTPAQRLQRFRRRFTIDPHFGQRRFLREAVSFVFGRIPMIGPYNGKFLQRERP